MYGLRLKPDETVRTHYRVGRYKDGEVQRILRIVWNGDENSSWISGDGFFANKGTGWRWCPENFNNVRGIAWAVSGMGGDNDDSEPIPRDDALAILTVHGVIPDSIDLGKYPSDEEQEGWQRSRRKVNR